MNFETTSDQDNVPTEAPGAWDAIELQLLGEQIAQRKEEVLAELEQEA